MSNRPIFTWRRTAFTIWGMAIAWVAAFLWRIGRDPGFIAAITVGGVGACLAWYWVVEIRRDRKQGRRRKMAEPKQILPWLNTGFLQMQVLANLENAEGERMRRAGEPGPEHVWADTQSVSLEESIALAPSLEGLCLQHAGAELSDRADQALRDEMDTMAERVIRQMPQEERDAIVAAARRRWDD